MRRMRRQRFVGGETLATALHAAYVGVGVGEVASWNDNRRRLVVKFLKFLLEMRNCRVEFPDNLEVSLPVCPDGVTRWEENRGELPVDPIALESDWGAFDKGLENDTHCLVDVPTTMERDGGRDLSSSFAKCLLSWLMNPEKD